MIRQLSRTELPCVLPLQQQVQALDVANEARYFHVNAAPEAYTQHLIQAMDKEGAWVLAAFRRKRAIGYLSAFPDTRPSDTYCCARNEVILDQICVDAQWRGQGVGRALVAAFERDALAQGFNAWRATHWSFNAASSALLERCGAVPSVITRRKVLSLDR
ncbi:MAG: GNAT family N-acetyltransferase [Marinovum sp.]|nr:GNAT family N-acetyltransferase [Marinovum sp.]